MKCNLTIDTSKILPNPEKDLENKPIQEQYYFVSSKNPKIINEVIKILEDDD